MISLIQHFEADFLWKVSLKILNSGIIPKTFTHVYLNQNICCSTKTYVVGTQMKRLKKKVVQMFKLMDKKIMTILHSASLFIKTHEACALAQSLFYVDYGNAAHQWHSALVV